jgi:hypothetical protein
MHTGLSMKKPLGIRPGLLLHDGLSTKDRILAAAGNESWFAHTFNNKSILLQPPLEPQTSQDYRDMTTEIMEGSTRKELGAVFCFSIEVGEDMHRVSFEWRKMKKSEEYSKAKGFKLVRLYTISNDTRLGSGNNDSSSQGRLSTPPSDNGDEILALLM